MIVLFIVLGLLGALLLFALLLPGSYKVSKTITVNSSISKCFEMVADLNNYRAWNPWSKMEPDAKSNLSGTPKTVGHQYTWEGKKIGMGGLTIIDISENKSVDLELAFIKPFESKASDNWIFEQLPDNQVKITWSNEGDLPFPVARLMGPMIMKNLNKQFVQGLINIKELCEK